MVSSKQRNNHLSRLQKEFFTSFFLISICISVHAQLKKDPNWEFSKNNILLNSGNYYFPNETDYNIHDILLNTFYKAHRYLFLNKNHISFSKCNFHTTDIKNKLTYTELSHYPNLIINEESDVAYSQCHFDVDLYIRNTNLQYYYTNNSIKNIYAAFSYQTDFMVEGNMIDSALDIYHSTCDYFGFFENKALKGKLYFRLKNSHFKIMEFRKNEYENFEVNFVDDTISDQMSFAYPYFNPDKRKIQKRELVFNKCYLNNSIYFNEPFHQTNITFNDCSFGNNVSISNFQSSDADTISFINCFKIPYIVNILPGDNKITLIFEKSDVSNISFDHLENFKLAFLSKSSREDKISVYENLLAKFKREGKLSSFEYIDIEYKKFNFGESLGGRLLSFIDKSWWNFGYQKWRIILWTIGLLLIYFVINLSIWNNITNIYPIILNSRNSNYRPKITKISGKFRLVTTVFIFTAYIFFSLKIDLNKLSFDKPLLVIYFFLQYITGLICVFFIANAILKL